MYTYNEQPEQGTKYKVQGTTGTRNKEQGTGYKEQGTRNKVQGTTGTRNKEQGTLKLYLYLLCFSLVASLKNHIC